MDSSKSRGSCRWLWWLVLLGPLALVLWWWLCPRRQCRIAAPAPVDDYNEIHIPIAVVTAGMASPDAEPEATSIPEEPIVPDDLRRIEGIGPKIASLLQDAGIATFAQLATAEVSVLQDVLTTARLGGIANPATWPEQAELAAAALWDDLASLQGSLKGGRRA